MRGPSTRLRVSLCPQRTALMWRANVELLRLKLQISHVSRREAILQPSYNIYRSSTLSIFFEFYYFSQIYLHKSFNPCIFLNRKRTRGRVLEIGLETLLDFGPTCPTVDTCGGLDGVGGCLSNLLFWPQLLYIPAGDWGDDGETWMDGDNICRIRL